MDHGAEAGVGFVVARRDAAKLFEIPEEVFHEMAPAVLSEVARDGVFAVGLGRDIREGAATVQFGTDPVDVEGLVAQAERQSRFRR